MEAIEQSKSPGSLGALIARFDEIENERGRLEGQLAEASKLAEEKKATRTTAMQIAHFIEHFGEVYNSVPVEQKKELLRILVSGIIVDRQRGVVRISIRRLPALTDEIKELLLMKTAPTSQVVSAVRRPYVQEVSLDFSEYIVVSTNIVRHSKGGLPWKIHK